ncbi:MAG: DUF2332 domain-containing protein [Actinomycetota bacterium]
MPQNSEVVADDAAWRLEIARRFGEFSNTTSRRAPLYAAMSTYLANNPELTDPLLAAPDTQRQPVLLLAAIHHLLIEESSEPLAAWYPNLRTNARPPDDPALGLTLASFITRRASDITELTAQRTTQTNEIGRCAFLLPALSIVAADPTVTTPLVHLDVGASGGLNLLLDRLAYRYAPTANGDPQSIDHTALGPDSTVELHCEVAGAMPVPSGLPHIAARCGIDRTPIDVTDPTEARWLEACVWPDQGDRFERLVAAIDIARYHPPELLAGDAVGSTVPALERMTTRGHPVVTNTWVLNYFDPAARQAYAAELDRFGASHNLSWIYAESPAQTPELDHGVPTDQHVTELTLVRWRAGDRRVDHLATCHPHGYWIDWRG